MRTPYKAWAATYLSLGWSPIPLPTSDKRPVPDHSPITRSRTHYTGTQGKYVDAQEVAAWNAATGRAQAGKFVYPPGNIALRLPQDVLGIDVDTYDGKAGAATLAAAEAEWGALPPTWISCNRLALPTSGIRLFRLPPGAASLSWPGDLTGRFGGGVELIRWDHRFAVVSPSVHPEGRVYFWRAPDGTVVDLAQVMLDAGDAEDGVEVFLPDVGDLCEMPVGWIGGLTEGRAGRGRSAAGRSGGADLTRADVAAWLAERTRSLGALMCAVMDRTLARALREVRKAGDDGGAHDVARDGAWALVGDAAAGHAGVEEALTSLRQVFLEAVSDRRGGVGGHRDGNGARLASEEWSRMVIRGVSKIASEGEPADSDRCATTATSGTAGRVRRGAGGARGSGTPFDYPRDDRGNARRLYNALGKGADVRWCAPLGGWFLWDAENAVWRTDPEGLLLRAIWSDIVDDMLVEAEETELESDSAKVAILRFAAGCGNLSRTNTAMELLKTLPGVAVSPGVFDADERLLLCSNGVVELRNDGSAFRPNARGDYLTLSTGVPYVAGADVAMNEGGVNTGAALWEGFLEGCLPDTEVRDWVQAAIGYSVLGANPERLLFICQGPTSTGKSTFVEAIRRVLGDHGGTFKFSLFKSEKEQGPNVALVRLLPQRFIATSEASQAQHLHVDEIKRLIGNEAIGARLNNANEMVERIPAFTPWISTNDAPTIKGADMGLFRRMITIPFGNVISEDSEDTYLGERLRVESAEAILAWIVRGWDMYVGMVAQGRKLRRYPEAVAAATNKMRGEISDFAVWLTARTAPAGAETITATDDLYADWEVWCDVNNVPAGSKPEFGRNLVKNGYVRAQGRAGDARYWGYRCIKIR